MVDFSYQELTEHALADVKAFLGEAAKLDPADFLFHDTKLRFEDRAFDVYSFWLKLCAGSVNIQDFKEFHSLLGLPPVSDLEISIYCRREVV
jgi:hypothetical protein